MSKLMILNEKCTVIRRYLDTNKGVILPSDSGSLLHDIPSEKCAYKILCILLSPEITGIRF